MQKITGDVKVVFSIGYLALLRVSVTPVKGIRGRAAVFFFHIIVVSEPLSASNPRGINWKRVDELIFNELQPSSGVLKKHSKENSQNGGGSILSN